MEYKYSPEELVKYLKNELDELPKQQVTEWLQEDPVHRQYFEQVKQIWEGSEDLDDQIIINTDEGWNRLAYKYRSGKMIRLISRYAAAILLLAGILGFFRLLLPPGKPVSLEIVIHSTDSVKHCQLPDGTKIILNKASRISYLDGFSKNRSLKLEGEAFFEVTPDKKHPFTIHCRNLNIEVVGTSFNVLANEKEVKVDVKTGKVKVYPEKMATPALLAPGEFATLNIREGVMRLGTHKDDNYLAWLTNRFSFNDIPLEEVTQFLSDHYGKPVRLKYPLHEKLRLTASFNGQKLEEVLDVIAKTLDLSIEKQNNSYLIVLIR